MEKERSTGWKWRVVEGRVWGWNNGSKRTDQKDGVEVKNQIGVVSFPPLYLSSPFAPVFWWWLMVLRVSWRNGTALFLRCIFEKGVLIEVVKTFLMHTSSLTDVVSFVFFQFHVTVHHTMINENTSLMQLLSIYFT